MNNEQIKKNDLELADILVGFHERLISFAAYRVDETSPEAKKIIQHWLSQPGGGTHLRHANELTILGTTYEDTGMQQ
jgi:hypothetical protein